MFSFYVSGSVLMSLCDLSSLLQMRVMAIDFFCSYMFGGTFAVHLYIGSVALYCLVCFSLIGV